MIGYKGQAVKSNVVLMSLSYAINHPHAVDSQALIDFFFFGLDKLLLYCPLNNPPHSSFSWSLSYLPVFPLTFSPSRIISSTVTDLWFLEIRLSLKLERISDYEEKKRERKRQNKKRKKVSIQGLALQQDHLEGSWSYRCADEVIKRGTESSTGVSARI